PWLATGWDDVALARAESADLVDGLRDHVRDVPRGGFTVLRRETGRALARDWGLQQVGPG
ncbi:MAG TPA: hypothetical protein VM434_13920, partial [Beijerinckiaceae bacterium]|nr:hypothetical protein [Beijerinckiaceae bacterium]